MNELLTSDEVFNLTNKIEEAQHKLQEAYKAWNEAIKEAEQQGIKTVREESRLFPDITAHLIVSTIYEPSLQYDLVKVK